MSDIFQEVQEEYRREQLAQVWTKYRIPIVAAAVGLVVAVAAYQGWVYWHNKVLDESSRQFEAALALMEKGAGQERAAAAAFAKLSHDGAGGYAFAAKLQEAATRAAGGDKTAAVSLYDQIADEGNGGQLFVDYARVRAAMLLIDTAPLNEIKKRLDPIAATDSPWRIQAEELLGYAYWRGGNKTEALRLLNLVKNNPQAAEGTKRRATELSALIAGGLKVADLKAAPTVTLTSPTGEPLAPGFPTFDAPTFGPPTPAPPTPAPPTSPTSPSTPPNTPTP